MFKLIAGNWRIFAAIGIILFSSLGLNAWQYSQNSKLIEDKATIQVARALCDADYEALKSELKGIKEDLAEIEKENEEMTQKIVNSKEVIRQINNDRELLLQKIRETIVPETCEGKFEWLREQAIEFSKIK